ncbi:hypothetical protein [Pararobbsia alpina]|uniref:Uncharacterized protein n=1 Tax=Pararobbsia alpina TaxID=621374 RepID=A0A6S7B709_9BURK|nr:hypothetical protein [Pararobbsia alpina]CAB3790024.1 hypothetical protein LMG28138_02897 [Pararobbsia alpina]
MKASLRFCAAFARFALIHSSTLAHEPAATASPIASVAYMDVPATGKSTCGGTRSIASQTSPATHASPGSACPIGSSALHTLTATKVYRGGY